MSSISYLRWLSSLALLGALGLLSGCGHLNGERAKHIIEAKPPVTSNHPLELTEVPKVTAPGIILVFEEHLRAINSDGDIDLAQKLSFNGERDWQSWTHEQNRNIANSDQLDQNAATLSDGQGGIFVVFEATATW